VNFNSHTDTVVRVAAQLVNLLTPGEERGRAYQVPAWADCAARLDALFKAAGSRTEVTAAEASEFGPAAAELRTVFAAVAAGDVDGAAHHLNGLLAGTGAHPVLELHDGEPWHLHFHSNDESSLSRGWTAGCATGLAFVLGGELYDRLGVCTAPRCDRVYVDTSRNGSKRFCSTACQNRVKTAAFRERRA
jgi:predicted RNA-binding Zn ribbon-like protein